MSPGPACDGKAGQDKLDSISHVKNTIKMIKKIWGLTLLSLIILALSACSSSTPTAEGDGGGGKKGGRGGRGGGAGGPVPVVLAQVTQRDVPVTVDVVGTAEAYSVISMKARVAGQITDVYFTEGDYVKKGDKLFSIDRQVLEGQLRQAQANMARSKAILMQSEAQLARDTAQMQYAQGQAGRTAQLVAQGIAAKELGEQQRSNADALSQTVAADRAAIESAKAQVQSDEANINNINIQLGFTTEYAPNDGRTGNITIKQGNIVTANNQEVATINQVEPIYVTFAVPESRLPDIKKYMAMGKLPVVAKPQDGSSDAETGVLTFVDSAVDTATGTIKLKGTFPNKDHKLWPGQFLNVTLRLTTQQNAITVPNAAVQNGQDGQFVYVVNEDRTAEMRPVVTGSRIGEEFVISKGLSAGETVVVEGQLRLQPGARVQARDTNNGATAPAGGGRGGKQGDASKVGDGGDGSKGGKGFKNGGAPTGGEEKTGGEGPRRKG